MDYTIRIGGEAGHGIQTIGETIARVFSRSGYPVFTHQDYESRVRGGHNYYQVRLSDQPVMASRDLVDIVVALDRESIIRHEKNLTKTGIVLYDSASLRETFEGGEGTRFLDVPFSSLATESGDKIMANTVAVGAVLGILGMKLDLLNGILRDTFQAKGEPVVQSNLAASAAGHAFVLSNCRTCPFPLKEPAGRSARPRMLINGSEAIGLGAVASGVKLYAAYPMTPSTGIMNTVADLSAEYDIHVEQAEDEISAINMVLGASFAGVRAMTGTSGGGFCLMVEGLSLAAMTETPAVIALAQRPGPATGFPTRTEQGELLFAAHAAHGEFPRVLLAPGTPEQAFFLTNKAFDLAEKYQVPAIIMTDQYLADCQWTLDDFDLTRLKLVDYRLREDGFGNLPAYRRHTVTETGVSPLGVPGDARHPVVTDSDEHDEEGHLVEDAETRLKMVDKRLFRKLPLMRSEMAPPELYGSDQPEIVLVGWGSTYGVIREAVDRLAVEQKAAMLHFSEILPFPSTDRFNFLELLGRAKLSICIENNSTGQFERLMRAETGYTFGARVNRYDGRPFTLDSLLGDIHDHLARL